MGGISKSVKKLTSGKFWKKGALHPLSQAGKKIGEMMGLDNTGLEQLAAAQAEANKAMPMPDDLELQRARRRAGATSRGGRASTIMSGGSNGQGLGG